MSPRASRPWHISVAREDESVTDTFSRVLRDPREEVVARRRNPIGHRGGVARLWRIEHVSGVYLGLVLQTAPGEKFTPMGMVVAGSRQDDFTTLESAMAHVLLVGTSRLREESSYVYDREDYRKEMRFTDEHEA